MGKEGWLITLGLAGRPGESGEVSPGKFATYDQTPGTCIVDANGFYLEKRMVIFVSKAFPKRMRLP
jgi:hypothetical protein